MFRDMFVIFLSMNTSTLECQAIFFECRCFHCQVLLKCSYLTHNPGANENAATVWGSNQLLPSSRRQNTCKNCILSSLLPQVLPPALVDKLVTHLEVKCVPLFFFFFFFYPPLACHINAKVFFCLSLSPLVSSSKSGGNSSSSVEDEVSASIRPLISSSGETTWTGEWGGGTWRQGGSLLATD